MDFSLNEDHLALREAVRRFCEGEYPAEKRGDAESPEVAAKRWTGMASLGLLGLPFASAYGGSDQGAVEVMLAAGEMGRVLGGGAYIPSIVLAGALLDRAANDEQKKRWLPELIQGNRRIAAALYEDGARYDWTQVATRAVRTPSGYSLSGCKTLVLHGDTARLFLVLARTSGSNEIGRAHV